MNYLTINDSNYNNVNTNVKQQSQLQQSQPQSQIQTQPEQQNVFYNSMNDMVMSDYCDNEITMFNNGYFSSSIYY